VRRLSHSRFPSRPRIACARWLRALLLSLAIASHAGGARADDLSDFEVARGRYERHEYARAVDAFRTLVGSEPPRIANALLVLESRKYYAASLLFVGAKEEAREQFRLLLQQEPDYTLDPLAFPKDVVTLFDQVKANVHDELSRQRAAAQQAALEAERKVRADEELRRQNLAELRGLAESREQLVQNSRWVATVPFGVGQFQNGDRGLGVALAMAESLAAATSIVSYIGHQSVRDDTPSTDQIDDARQTERLWRNTNYVSFGTFAALAIIGIIDAHVRFVPGRVKSSKRPLSPELDGWLRQQQGRAWGPAFRF
jgi:hypothetical protein